MFVRKGTTRRKKQQQTARRQRQPSLPVQNTTNDPERGESGIVAEQTGVSETSTTSSTLTLNEEKSLVEKSNSFSRQNSCQHGNYGSIFLQFQEAHLESADVYDFLQRIWEIIWHSFAMTVILLLLFGLPISMVAVGTSYLEECPKEPKLPTYLLVGGTFGFIHICILLWHQKRSRAYTLLDDSKDDADSDENDVMTRSYRFTLYVLSMFLIVWFTLGNYWLFSIWQPNFSQPLHEPRNWCSHKLYSYIFYQVVICYSLAGIAILMFIGCLAIYFYGITRTQDHHYQVPCRWW